MSFYLEEDQKDRAVYRIQDSGTATKAEPATGFFVCDNCNGVQSYLDDTSGALVCAECFTHSQTTIAASQEVMDYDDTMVMAGRISGRFKSSYSSPASRLKVRKRARLEELDRSDPLPDAESCINALQRVLREAALIIAKLLCCDRKDKLSALRACSTIWKSYLTSWKEAAHYFALIYPEVRFSFRDEFLHQLSRSIVLKNIAEGANKKARRGNKGMPHLGNSPLGRKRRSQSKPSSLQNRSNIRQIGFSLPFTEKDVVPESQSWTARMLGFHQKEANQRSCGRKTVAMSLRPSLHLVSAILSLAFSRFGVTCAMIRAWMEDGRLPLCVSFQLLSQEEQSQLSIVKGFFVFNDLPPVRFLETLTEKLRVISKFGPSFRLVRNRCLHSHEPVQKVAKNSTAVVSLSSLPMVLGRMIVQLGLSQSVFDFSMALLGLPVSSSRTGFTESVELPRPQKANACNRHVRVGLSALIYVVVLACRIIMGEEMHWYSYQDCVDHLSVSTIGGIWYSTFLEEGEICLLALEEISIRSLDFRERARVPLSLDAVVPNPRALCHGQSIRQGVDRPMRQYVSPKPEDVRDSHPDMLITPPPLGILLEFVCSRTGLR